MNNNTDYLGNPVGIGDIFVYPTQTGSSAADMNMARVTAIDEIVGFDPNDPTARDGYLHCDRNQEYPPRRTVPAKWIPDPLTSGHTSIVVRDDSKCYRIRAKRLRMTAEGYRIYNPDRTITIRNVDRIVVVSSLTDQRKPIV